MDLDALLDRSVVPVIAGAIMPLCTATRSRARGVSQSRDRLGQSGGEVDEERWSVGRESGLQVDYRDGFITPIRDPLYPAESGREIVFETLHSAPPWSSTATTER